MIRTRFKKVLLVAPSVFPEQLLNDCENVKHIDAIGGIFPTLFEQNPNVLIFDYDYLANDIERILRRIKINRFYDKLKICCYKSEPNTKTDSLLRALGVDQVFYRADISREKSKSLLSNVGDIFDTGIRKIVAGVSH